MVLIQYKCQACEATFDNIADLQAHTHIQYLYYECEKCGEIFNSEIKLNNHLTSVRCLLNKEEFQEVNSYLNPSR